MPEPRSTRQKRDSDEKNLPRENTPEDGSLMHSMKEGKQSSSFLSSKLFVFIVIAALLGVGSGYFLSQNGGKTGISSLDKVTRSSNVEKGKTYGTGDTSVFKDTAEGVMTDGGIEGEGSDHLVRPGGDSQNVYLTSSSVDLSQFHGRKVKVWGQTQKAQTAGWLMDVGKIQVLD